MTTLVHPFEQAGLGKAPFRYVGSERVTYQAHPDAPVQPGGSCDLCGHAIMEHCYIVSADGRRFKVGCDCVMKTHSKGSPLYTAAEKALRTARKAVKDANELARIEQARALLEADPALLTDRPHTQKWAADKGMTARDELEWLFANAGRAGKLRASRIIEGAAA